MGEIAEQEAQRVAELAVGLDIGLDDVGADAEILGIVGAHGPEAQDLGAGLADHVLRRHHIAERLRHLAPVLVDDEAVRDHRLVGRAAARAASFQQRGLEPAAMLVGAFEIERRPAISGRGAAPARRRGSSLNRTRRRECRRPSPSRRGCRRGLARKRSLGALPEPGIGAFLAEGVRRCGRSARRTR